MDNARINPLAPWDNIAVDWLSRRKECVAPRGTGPLHARTPAKQFEGAARREGRPSLGDADPYAPLMADLMSGPNAPLTRAFLWCGWRCITVDWLLDDSHDLANPLRQASLAAQLEEQRWIALLKVEPERYQDNLMMADQHRSLLDQLSFRQCRL